MVNKFMTVLRSSVNKLRFLRHSSEKEEYFSGQAAREGKIETRRKWEVAREADIHPQSLLGKPMNTLGFAWQLEKRGLDTCLEQLLTMKEKHHQSKTYKMWLK